MEKKKAKSTTSSKKTATSAKTKKVVKAKVEKEAKVVEKEVTKAETKKSNHGTFIVLGIVILAVTILTWIIKGGTWTYGSEGGALATFTANEEVTSQGINEVFLAIYYAINYYLIQLVFLGILGIFYGVVSKTKGYKVMIKKIASLFKKNEMLFILLTSLLIAVFTSFTTQPIVVLAFVPMLYSVAKELKVNKVSAMLSTYGALAVGLMGVTYGSYGLYYAMQSMKLEIGDGILFRAIILVIGYLVLNVFTLIFNKSKSSKKAELVEDNFELVDDESKGKAIPYIILFAVLFVFAILGYIGWDSAFKIDIFTNFHEWLTTKVVIGQNEFPIFAKVLGNIGAFGTWDPFVMGYLMLIALIPVAIFSKVKFNQTCDNALAGLKKMAKPIVLVSLAYTVFVLCYWSGITTSIVNFFNSGDKFNPYLLGLGNSIADFLHVDVEYTGFALSQFYATKFADSTNLIVAIMTATSGFTALFVPTSVFMLIGLSLSDLSYKDWFKAIWKFVLALAIVLCVLFTIFTFIKL